jgi:cell division protein FtsI (penicillin-binding protein 3)
MSVLEDKYVTTSDTININNGSWVLNGRNIRDAERSPKSVLTIKEAFEHSSNVAMAKLAYNYYAKDPARFTKHYEALRLTGRTGVDLKEEFRPLVKTPSRKDWHLQTLPSMGFGYEVMLSPLQILTVYNAVANEGRLMKPYLVNRIEKDGNLLYRFEPAVLNENICSQETLRQLKECLNAVCSAGTARSVFKDAVYHAAGKTGTTKVNDGRFRYTDGAYQSSFAGYFPADDPKYSCIVVIKNKPHVARYFGGAVAAPVFREIADKLYAESADRQQWFVANAAGGSNNYRWSGQVSEIKNVLDAMKVEYKDSVASGKWAVVDSNTDMPVLKELPAGKQAVPDVKGMGLKDALLLLENMNMKVTVKGKGKVISQSLQAGMAVSGRETIALELN